MQGPAFAPGFVFARAGVRLDLRDAATIMVQVEAGDAVWTLLLA